MGDTDTEAVHAQLLIELTLVSLEDKELTTDLTHDRQLLLSEACYSNTCQIAQITLSKK